MRKGEEKRGGRRKDNLRKGERGNEKYRGYVLKGRRRRGVYERGIENGNKGELMKTSNRKKKSVGMSVLK